MQKKSAVHVVGGKGCIQVEFGVERCYAYTEDVQLVLKLDKEGFVCILDQTAVLVMQKRTIEAYR